MMAPSSLHWSLDDLESCGEDDGGHVRAFVA